MTRHRDLQVPPEVLAIIQTLEAADFETWCVGGAIRDNLLGFPNKDYDLATAAKPTDVRRLFRRTIPLGIQHGTVAVVDERGVPHEVTTFRRDVRTDGRHAVVEFGASLEEDLARRDFTINAIAYSPTRDKWMDLHGGHADLAARVVRAVGDPQQRFREDYLRVLRALRFAARFGFEIEAETREAAGASVDGLQYLSAERVRDEWCRGLQTAKEPSGFVSLWVEIGALSRLLPEIDTDRIGPRRERLDALPRDPVLLTSYLSDDPASTLKRLRCSNAEIERGRLIGLHRDAWPDPDSDLAVRRWLHRTGPAADDLIELVDSHSVRSSLAAVVERVRRSDVPLRVQDLAVGGTDLMDVGVPQGPAVGRVLEVLMNDVLEDPVRNAREYLLARVDELLQSDRGEGGGSS